MPMRPGRVFESRSPKAMQGAAVGSFFKASVTGPHRRSRPLPPRHLRPCRPPPGPNNFVLRLIGSGLSSSHAVRDSRPVREVATRLRSDRQPANCNRADYMQQPSPRQCKRPQCSTWLQPRLSSCLQPELLRPLISARAVLVNVSTTEIYPPPSGRGVRPDYLPGDSRRGKHGYGSGLSTSPGVSREGGRPTPRPSGCGCISVV